MEESADGGPAGVDTGVESRAVRAAGCGGLGAWAGMAGPMTLVERVANWLGWYTRCRDCGRPLRWTRERMDSLCIPCGLDRLVKAGCPAKPLAREVAKIMRDSFNADRRKRAIRSRRVKP